MLENIPEKVRELLHSSQVCGELLIHLVNNILDTGKADIGELEVNPTPNDLNDLLEKIWSICSQLISNKRLHGNIRIKKNIPKVLKLDHHRLTQIFLNLIGNAIKFTDEGSISIDISWFKDADKVTESCFQPIPFDEEDEGQFDKAQKLSVLEEDVIVIGSHWKKFVSENEPRRQTSSRGILKIIVVDTGCGIAAEKIPELFHKFTQVGDDLTKRTLGTGLGLYITKQLVQRMKGDVKLYSKAGKGSAFIVCIPVEVVQECQIENPDVRSPLIQQRLEELNVMVVDDQDFNRVVLTLGLNKLGVHVKENAKNGQEALEKYKMNTRKDKSFDIVTMDVDMPIMDGKRASQLIREFERQHNMIPCLLAIVSGNCTESETDQCLNENGSIKANFFLKKPTSIDDLAKVVKARLGGRKARV
jgi:CheY-like chemotaxis protein